MARQKSPVELAAYIVAVVGPLGLYFAHKASLEAPVPLDMPDVAVALETTTPPDAPVVPDQANPPARPALPPPPAVIGADLEFALVSDGRLLLHTGVPKAWGQGKPLAGPSGEPSEPYPESYAYAEKVADAEALPASYANLVGKRIDLYGQLGTVCSAEIAGLAVVAEVNGESWYLFDGLEEDEQIVTDEEGYVSPSAGRRIRKLTYDRAERWLMASYAVVDGGDAEACASALFGRGSALPAPRMLTPRKGSVAKSVKDEFLTEASTELRADYEKYVAMYTPEEAPEGADWHALVENSYERTVYVDGSGKPTLVHQRVGDYQSTCGDGFGDYHARMRPLGSSGAVVPAYLSEAPALLVDADGNGKFEVIGGDWDVTYYGDDGEYRYTARRPYEGCPC